MILTGLVQDDNCDIPHSSLNKVICIYFLYLVICYEDTSRIFLLLFVLFDGKPRKEFISSASVTARGQFSLT